MPAAAAVPTTVTAMVSAAVTGSAMLAGSVSCNCLGRVMACSSRLMTGLISISAAPWLLSRGSALPFVAVLLVLCSTVGHRENF